ncbi:MAG: c-type cytochrome domain-containing protein [Verrucomicrobiota bacterium]
MLPRTLPPWFRLPLGLALAILLGGWPASATGALPGEAAPPAFSWARFLAPFHLVILHFPIGFLTLAVLLEARAWRRSESTLRPALQYVLRLTVVAGVVTLGLGFFRALDDGYEPGLISRHRSWGLVAALLLVCTWQLHGFMIRQARPGGALAGFRILLGLCLGTLVIAGHHGGSLTHGKTFLTENAPEPLRHLLAGPATAPATTGPGMSSIGGLPVPITQLLHDRCLTCHGVDKKKGGFRVDAVADLQAGGRSGRPGVVPGDPGRSEVVRVTLLARSHEEAMPPEGREPLSPEEMSALVSWIREGAPGLPSPPSR